MSETPLKGKQQAHKSAIVSTCEPAKKEALLHYHLHESLEIQGRYKLRLQISHNITSSSFRKYLQNEHLSLLSDSNGQIGLWSWKRPQYTRDTNLLIRPPIFRWTINRATYTSLCITFAICNMFKPQIAFAMSVDCAGCIWSSTVTCFSNSSTLWWARDSWVSRVMLETLSCSDSTCELLGKVHAINYWKKLGLDFSAGCLTLNPELPEEAIFGLLNDSVKANSSKRKVSGRSQ